MSKGDDLLEKLRTREFAATMEQRMAEAEMREKHPAIKDAWEQYQLMLKLYK